MVALKMKDRIIITVDSRLGRWGQERLFTTGPEGGKR